MSGVKNPKQHGDGVQGLVEGVLGDKGSNWGLAVFGLILSPRLMQAQVQNKKGKENSQDQINIV